MGFRVWILFAVASASLAANCTEYIRIEKTSCAQICLGSFVGICPVAIVIKTGGLHEDTCSSHGYTKPNGTTTVSAGPCGKITFDVFEMGSFGGKVVTTFSDADTDRDLVNFGGNSTVKWMVEDDPVMGGKSHSQLEVTDSAHWYGVVAIVPFLDSPGFATFRSQGINSFPDATGTTILKMYARNSANSTIEQFNLQLKTSVDPTVSKQGTYNGQISVPATGKWMEVASKWDAFKLTWRGQPMGGPALTTQLDQIQQMGLSTYFPGKVGAFDLEIMWMKAGTV